jgi:MFS transporter, ACS family, glucarate transporter
MSLSTSSPTRTRFVLAAWLCGLAAILYLDRICMAQAIGPIQNELELSNSQLSYVMMAFTLAYGIFEIPTGRLGDRIGARKVLTRIVVWWSLFTALTGATFGFASLLAIRFLFGAGEAGAYPNVARVLSRWFPAHERGRVQGVMLTAAQLGAVAAPALAAYMIELAGWRWAFVAFGAVGVFWAMGFWLWFRDIPAEHARVNAAELEIIQRDQRATTESPGPIPWHSVVRSRTIWSLGSAIIFSAFNSYFYFSWFSKYLQSARNVSNVESGWLSSLALAGTAVGVLTGGVIADRILRQGLAVASWRRWFGASAFVASALLLLLGSQLDEPIALAIFAALSCLAFHLTLPTWWSATIEVSGHHVGALFGLLNSLGVFGALASQWFVGAFSDWRAEQGYSGREQWDPLFYVYVAALACGAMCWATYRGDSLKLPESVASP